MADAQAGIPPPNTHLHQGMIPVAWSFLLVRRDQIPKSLNLFQHLRPLGRVELPHGRLGEGVLVIVLAVTEAADRGGGAGRPQDLGQLVGNLGYLTFDRPDAEHQVVPGQSHLKVQGPFRVRVAGFEAFKGDAAPVFPQGKIEGYG